MAGLTNRDRRHRAARRRHQQWLADRDLYTRPGSRYVLALTTAVGLIEDGVPYGQALVAASFAHDVEPAAIKQADSYTKVEHWAGSGTELERAGLRARRSAEAQGLATGGFISQSDFDFDFGGCVLPLGATWKAEARAVAYLARPRWPLGITDT